MILRSPAAPLGRSHLTKAPEFLRPPFHTTQPPSGVETTLEPPGDSPQKPLAPQQISKSNQTELRCDGAAILRFDRLEMGRGKPGGNGRRGVEPSPGRAIAARQTIPESGQTLACPFLRLKMQSAGGRFQQIEVRRRRRTAISILGPNRGFTFPAIPTLSRVRGPSTIRGEAACGAQVSSPV